jgi:voltage-gated potassium channel Kch
MYANLFRAAFAALADRRAQALLVVCAGLAGLQAVIFRLIEGWSLLDGFYFAVVTMATVGYGDLAPQTNIGKLAAIAFMLVGIGVFVLTVSTIAQAFLREMELSRGSRLPSDGAGNDKP